jgi:hypothetical protein
MIVYTIHHGSICGDFTHEFTSRAQAEHLMRVLTANHVKFSVVYAQVDAPTQLDLPL